MRIGLVVDAGCDLPEAILADESVVVLPIAVRIGDYLTEDSRTRSRVNSWTATSPRMLPRPRPSPIRSSRSASCSSAGWCTSSTTCSAKPFPPAAARSTSAVQASFGILNDYHAIREAGGNKTPFALRVQNTGNLFAAQALPAWDTLRQRRLGESPMKIRTRLERVVNANHGLVVTPDLYYMRNRGRKKGDRSISMMSAMLGTALDVKPVVHSHRGETTPVAKVRGF